MILEKRCEKERQYLLEATAFCFRMETKLKMCVYDPVCLSYPSKQHTPFRLGPELVGPGLRECVCVL